VWSTKIARSPSPSNATPIRHPWLTTVRASHAGCVDPQSRFPALEERVLDFWERDGTFRAWMEAAQKKEIPTGFIVDRQGKIMYIGNPLDPWGADEPARAYLACFEAMAASGAYDVLALVHDFPYRSLQSEVNTANEVTAALLAATADRPDILPVYVSLTSGEPPPETKKIRILHSPGICLIPEYLAEELLRLEGFSEVEYVGDPKANGFEDLAADKADVTISDAPGALPVLDAMVPALSIAPTRSRSTRCRRR
jgi:hypothetical protein